MSKVIDLTGQRFGKLIVIARAKNNSHNQAQWLCRCDCGTEFVTASNSLRSGRTKSCGCAVKDFLREARKKFNDYRIDGDTVYVKLSNCDKEMIVDRDVWEAGAKEFCWHCTKYGYAAASVFTRPNKKLQLFHVYAFPNCPDGMVRDHIDGNKLNNKRGNIRFVSQTDNCKNRPIEGTGKSGRRGVSWNSRRKRWKSTICVNNRVISLGFFENVQEAVHAREEAEEKYLGRYRRKE